MKVKQLKNYSKYFGLIILIIAHFFGESLANLAIVVSSIYAFYYFIFKKEVDLFVLFLLLFPSICLVEINQNTNSLTRLLLANFHNVFIIGPLALSVKLALALAVPFKLLFYSTKRIYEYVLLFLWIILVLFSIYGLFLGISIGNENPAGLTVGFRIALSIGVLLMPKIIKDKNQFYSSINKIIVVSIIFMIIGLMNGHWFFVVFGFIPYFWSQNKSMLLRGLFITSIPFLLTLETTFTILGAIVLSFVFYILIKYKKYTLNFITNKFSISIIILLPLFFTFYVLNLPSNNSNYDFSSIGGLIEFKILGDRKPIWDASFKQIINSSFFVVPAGASLLVYFDYINTWTNWEPGAHNIFLETGRQIGTYGMLLISVLTSFSLLKGSKFHETKDLIFYYSIISVYIAYGITGNSLIYDGVGFLFWLIFSQFYRLNSIKNDTNKLGLE